MTNNLLYKNCIPVDENISIYIPTVGEIIENEDEYYSLISALTASPVDLMVQLDDAGIDFTAIDDYELFLIMFREINSLNTKLVFGDLDLSKFKIALREDDQAVLLRDEEKDINIDRLTHARIAATLRKVHHLEKNRKKPGNKEAKEYMLERARVKMKRAKRLTDSQLESLIIAMVNTEQYKYNYESTKNLSIYQFNESVRQIINKVDYDNRMFGVYSGTISAKDLSQDDLNWLKSK